MAQDENIIYDFLIKYIREKYFSKMNSTGITCAKTILGFLAIIILWEILRMIHNTNQSRRWNQSNSSSEMDPNKDRKNIIDFNICNFVLSSGCNHASEDRKSAEDVTIGYNIDDQDNIHLNSQGCCSICLDDLEEGDTLAKSKFPEVSNCGHIFHYDCLHHWSPMDQNSDRI